MVVGGGPGRGSHFLSCLGCDWDTPPWPCINAAVLFATVNGICLNSTQILKQCYGCLQDVSTP